MKKLFVSVLIVVIGLSVYFYRTSHKKLSSLIQGKKDTLVVKLINTMNDKEVHTSLPTTLLGEIFAEKYDVKISDKDYDMTFELPYDNNPDRDYSKLEPTDPKIIKMFYTAEAILPNLNNYDLVIGFDRIEDPRYIRVPWYYFYSFGTKIRADYNRKSDQGECKPNKKYFACFLVTNGSEGVNWRNHQPFDGSVARTRIFHKLSLYKRVESGGKLLNNIGEVVPARDTMEWLSQCKFVIAYENQSYDGYITEKPFQAYFAGAIPIYYGSQTAVTDMNRNAIIYAGDFTNEDDLVEYVKKVDNDDDLYCKIWNQNIITDPERNFDNVSSKLANKIYEVIDSKLHK